MKITWYGHSCFLIEDSKGRRLLTDPFDNSIGYDVFDDSADIVTISHHHFDHDYYKMVKGNPEVINKVGFFNEKDIVISGIPSYHDKMKGSKRGENVIFVFEMDGYRLCHLGDLGYILNEDEIDKIGSIDVLFIPVGGNFTINGKEAGELCKKMKSKIVIPMHYGTQYLSFPLEGAEEFIKCMGNGERVSDITLTIEDKLEKTNQVLLLPHTNLRLKN